MTHAGSSEHAAAGAHGAGHAVADVPPWQTLFSADQWHDLRTADRQAARNIVSLMTAIFITGLIGYVGICVWVA
jgi:hypothetical protein